MTSSDDTSTPNSRPYHCAIPARSAGKPATGVYFVRPSSRARLAASTTDAGVLKSGSPAPKLTISAPSAFIAAALAVIASVSEG